MVLLETDRATPDTTCNTVKKYLFFLLFFSAATQAQLKISPLFADHMVIQRDKIFRVTGTAVPGKTVRVNFSGITRQTQADKHASWVVVFPAMKASWQPAVLSVVCGEERITLQDILIGDRWLCLGQSNMEFPMQKEMHAKTYRLEDVPMKPRILNPVYAGKNIFNMKYNDSVAALLQQGSFYKGQWEQADTVSIRSMSAVGWYFGARICAATKIPVGLINLSIGGAPLETFISLSVMKNNPAFAAKTDTGWLHNPALPVWIRERGMQNVEGVAHVPADALGPDHAYRPGYAFREGIEPLLALPCKGMIWYQGESNAQEPERVAEYAALFKLMTDDYRSKWKDPAMPCYWVQLSSIDTVKYKGQLWGWFRDEQRRMMEMIPYSGMAVCSDIGFRNDVHPTDKSTVGERLARQALCHTYHQDIIPSGPLPLKAWWTAGKVIITFQYTAKGLNTAGSDTLQGFTIDGHTPCVAYIKNGTVEIPLPEKPSVIYYGWRSWSDGNLVNSEGLPASTFKIPVR